MKNVFLNHAMKTQIGQKIIIMVILLLTSCDKSHQKVKEEKAEVEEQKIGLISDTNEKSNEIDCEQLSNKYSSYKEAVKKIKAAKFKIEESITTSKSSWIKSAAYYSCDGITGFFILNTGNQEYLYSGVPKKIWRGFKEAESVGSFFNDKIKYKYFFNLKKTIQCFTYQY